jgi:hypothetical protein
MKITYSEWASSNSSTLSKVLIGLIVIYPLIFIWQCGDLTDSGFFYISYDNFFNNLKIGETNSISFLSDLIGATFNKLFPKLFIIGYKFLYVIFYYATIIVAYKILRPFTQNKNILLVALFAAVTFSERYTMFVFSRDQSSWFFLITTCFFYLKGLEKKKLSCLYFAGFSLTLACLCRFPNIVFIGLGGIPLLYHFFYKEKGSFWVKFLDLLKSYFSFILGFITSAALFYFILKYYKIDEIFISNLDLLSKKSESSYSINKLFIVYKLDIFNFIPQLVAANAIAFIAYIIYCNWTKRKIKSVVFGSFFILVLLAFIIVYKDYSYSSEISFLLPALCFLPLLFSLIKKDKTSLLVVVSLVLAITQIAGSNTGIFMKLSYGFILLLPTSILIIEEQQEIKILNNVIPKKVIINSIVILVACFCLINRFSSIYNVQSSLMCRLGAFYKINNPRANGIYTTKTNASHINNLLTSIKNNLTDSNTLFIFGHQPTIYYLAQQKPPVKKYWLNDKFVSPEELFTTLLENIYKTKKYPLVINTKENILLEDGEKKLTSFLNENQYKCVETHKEYEVWKK